MGGCELTDLAPKRRPPPPRVETNYEILGRLSNETMTRPIVLKCSDMEPGHIL
jgi:hypothetical protein